MAYRREGYYYDAQLKNYILQFMAIFSGLQVQIGKWNTQDERLISVPVHYGHMDRVVAAIMSENTQNKPLRLPMMSAYLRSFNIDPERMAGTGFERRQAYTPVGGLVPDDIKVIHQRKPVPYKLELDLSIYASNTDQHFQIVEQILPLFDPQLNIQTSDGIFDWTRLTHVMLKGISNDSNYPIGTDRRIVQSTMQFEMPVWIDTPADVRSDFIKRILVRIGTIDTDSNDSFEIIGDLDGQNIPYEVWQDVDTLNLEGN